MPGPLFVPPLFIASDPPTLSYVTNVDDTSAQGTYTFASASIGTAASDRVVIVAVSWEATSSAITLNSASIGGISAAIADQISEASGGTGTAIIAALVPTGTTANIVLTLSASAQRCCVGIWRATSLNATSPTDTVKTSGNGSSTSASLDIEGRGIVVGAITLDDPGVRVSFSNLTERYDADLGSGTSKAGADYTNASDSGETRSVGASYSVASYSFVAAAFR